jgi:antirestriction protein ArdC
MSTNHVQMHLSCFGMLSPYATFAHEIAHWARHPFRLNRDFGGKRFGNEGYAVEELVAELGTAKSRPPEDPGPSSKNQGQPHATNNASPIVASDGNAMRSQSPDRETVPVFSGEGPLP